VIEANQIRLTGPQTFGGPTSLTYRVSDGAGSSAVATLGLLFQNPRLFFYATGAPNSSQRRIRYSNYFVNIELDTPIPAGETFDRFTTSLNGQWVLYVTRSNGPPVRHRLWLRSVGVPTDPVVEIPTFDPSFFVRHLALSPDGTLVAFNGRVAATANPAAHVPIDNVGIDIERPTFSNDSRSLFYSVLFNGGGRVIKRASIDSSANITQRTQITADYPTAQGLGIDYRLTPQDDQVVSLGLIMPAGGGPGASIQQHAFVTPNDGSMADARLHPLPTPPIEGVSFLPVVSPDGRYAIYPATLNGGVSGLYSTDLQSPGTAILLAANAPSPGAHVFAGARTVLYPMPAAQPQGQNWFKAAVDVAASGVPFAPASGAPAPRIVAPALDGSAVVLDGGSQVYAAFGEQFDTATSLLTLANGDTVALLKYATDSNAVFVVGASGDATILNPEAPGWSAALVPLPDYSAGIAAACIVSPGEGC
jgi:hypothetical protein